MIDINSLSAEAQKIIELTGQSLKDDVDVAAVLQQHPELIKGLNEYIRWRSECGAEIEKKETARPAGHSIGKAARRLAKPRK